MKKFNDYKYSEMWLKIRTTLSGGGQAAIDALRAKQGQPQSIDPDFHADTLQAVYDDVRLNAVTAGAIDFVKAYGAKLDEKTDETALLLKALSEHDAVYIGKGSEYPDDPDNVGRLLFSDTIVLNEKKLFVNGELFWNAEPTANKPAIHLQRCAWLEGGVAGNNKASDGSYLRHFSDRKGSRHGSRDCAILVHKAGGGTGCIESRVRNFIVDGYGITSAGMYSSAAMNEIKTKPESECRYATGKGLWLLAGCDYGFTGDDTPTYNYMEFVYRNSFENVRINGYGDPVMLEAGWLYLSEDPTNPDAPTKPAPIDNGKPPEDPDYKRYSPNGWVNGNKFDGLWIRYGRRYIHLLAPMGDFYPLPDGGYSTKATLCGECSGNFFTAVDIQTSGGTYERGLVIEGGNFNQLEIMHWDANPSYYPLVILKQGFPNVSKSPTSLSQCSSRNNYVNITGSHLTESNGGYVDEYSGNNYIVSSSTDVSRNFLPIGSNSNSTYSSVIGSVNNYWGNGENLYQNKLSIYNVDENGERSGENRDESINQVSGKLLTSNVSDRWRYIPSTSKGRYGVELEMINENPVSIKNTGVCWFDNEQAQSTVDIFYYDSAGVEIDRVTLHCLNAAACVDTKGYSAVKKVVIRFWDMDQIALGKQIININNVFTECTTSGSSNNNYNVQPNKDAHLYGKKITFDYRMKQQYNPSGAGLIDGYFFPDDDAQAHFVKGYPSSPILRANGYTMDINRPVEIAEGMELIMTDRVSGDKVNIYVSGGNVLAEDLTPEPVPPTK